MRSSLAVFRLEPVLPLTQSILNRLMAMPSDPECVLNGGIDREEILG